MNDEQEWWAGQFEENRGHLRAVAYRMLGSAGEAEDAVQEAWLRLTRTDAAAIENLSGWLTTVVARVCLDTLRARAARREEPLPAPPAEPAANNAGAGDPEREAQLADSVGLALLIVLDRLAPAERIAFVLHDMFDVPFDEIASIVKRSPDAARQLASRARRRVQGAEPPAGPELTRRRKVVDAFLAALRGGDVQGLLAVLDPDVAVHIDEAAGRPGAPREIRGAATFAHGAVTFSQLARAVEPMLVDGSPGLAWASGGKLARVLKLTIADEKIVDVEIIADPARLRDLDLSVLE